jgi:hypothetical protein
MANLCGDKNALVVTLALVPMRTNHCNNSLIQSAADKNLHCIAKVDRDMPW